MRVPRRDTRSLLERQRAALSSLEVAITIYRGREGHVDNLLDAWRRQRDRLVLAEMEEALRRDVPAAT